MSGPAEIPAGAARPIVCFASSDFEAEQWVNAQHLMWRLAERRRVLYVNSLGLRAPRADRRDLTKIARRLGGLTRLTRQPDPRRDLHVFAPLTLPPRPSRRWQRWSARLLAWRLRRAAARLRLRDPLLWVFLPTAEPVLGALGPAPVLYHCVDAYEANPGVNADLIRALERRLLARADRVIATSGPLYERLRGAHGAVQLMPNVADLDLFPPPEAEPARLPAEPADLAAIPRPRLLYVGNVAGYKCDLAGIAQAARRRPDWSWVLVGPRGLGESAPALGALRAAANVHLLGPRDRRQLAGYIHHCAVGLIPFRVSESTRHSFPMKFFEYLACGRPVVSADLPSLRDHFAPGIAHAYGDRAGLPAMEAAIADALAATGPEWARRRRALAEAHSWERRMTEIEALIADWTAGAPQ